MVEFIYNQNSEPGTHLIQVTSQGILRKNRTLCNKENRKKQTRVNWSASSGVIFRRSGI